MAPKTVQDLFGRKPEEINALAVLAGLEGFRGDDGRDVQTAAATALARSLHGGYGGRDIRNVATAPGQFEAIYGRNINMQQLGDPAFGAKILGGQDEFNRIRNLVNDPIGVGREFQRSKGALSFRGTAGYANRKPGDYTPIPGKSNFYFDSDPKVLKQGMSIFGSPTAMQQPSAMPARPVTGSPPFVAAPPPVSAPPPVNTILSRLGLASPKTEEKKNVAQEFALGILRQVMRPVFGTTP